MSASSAPTYFNKSAYVALSCLIAFAVVITICILKQFIWDPLLSRRFEVLRPVLSESVRRLSNSFYRAPSTRTSLLSHNSSFSDICAKTNEPPSVSRKNFLTVTQTLPSNGIQNQIHTNESARRTYGSSSTTPPYGYTNFAAGDFNDEHITAPILYLSFQYSLSANNVKLTVQDLRHMNKFKNPINANAYVLIRCFFTKRIADRPFETSPQRFQDCIRFGETFNILNHIQLTDTMNYELKFSIILITSGNMYEIAEAIYSMKDDDLTTSLFVEKTLPIQFKPMEKETK
ncbi:unnamed protein product [Rotaria magnacalcarata]|uniref:Uncharacterized protein n=1 Tax=Rotaria magnacalcarata TaxID=392030 RepID=A0A816SNK4_9BILA|nr:unnamed protein product [Rotaria magnacalcarata]CAF1676501.1 unnamed protein product [Rotaria magnacalcarata]CAF2089165.1 unnamed protein product [Rotaria magnacalcarata]CAF2092693.1 unnamed protein product [Rotaria magnacalcarata]CAF2253858.1 unnamed protein product [Rotaria magnacalcarata]